MFLYCIRHEEMVPTAECQTGASGFCHEFASAVPDSRVLEFEFCDFSDGFATCPPPEFDMNEFIQTLDENDLLTDDLDAA